MLAIRVRQAIATDIPAMWTVRYAVTENPLTPGRISDEEFRSEIEDSGRGFVAEVDDRIVGFAVGNARTGNVWALFVTPEAQGRGVGEALHRALLTWFRSQPPHTLWLSTGTATRARAFYEKHGWRCVGPYGDAEVRYERPNRIG